MKIRFPLLAFLVFTCTFHIHAQLGYGENEYAETYSKNKVKSVKSYEHRYRNGKMKGKGKLYSHEILDSAGREIESWSYLDIYTFMRSKYHKQYQYNERGDLSQETGFVLNDPVTTNFLYKYDDQQRIIEKKEDRSFSNKWIYAYDTTGKLICTTWYTLGETPNSFFFVDSFYYENDLLVRKKRFNNGRSLYFYLTYQYDSKGNLAVETRYENEKPTDVWIRQYDEKGNRIKMISIDKLSKSQDYTECQYNEQGLIVATFGVLRDQPFYRRIVYEYD